MKKFTALLILFIFLSPLVPIVYAVSPPAEVDSTSSNGSGTNINVTLPTNNNSQLVVITFHISHDIEAPDISTPAGWTAIPKASGSGQFMQVFYRQGDGTTSVTFPTSISVIRYVWRAVTYSSVDLANPINVSQGNTSSFLTIHSAPSVTTTTANCLVVYAFGSGQRDAVFTLNTAITERFNQPGSVIDDHSVMLVADKVQSTAGSTGSASVTASVSCFGVNFTLAINPAPALRRKRKAIVM